VKGFKRSFFLLIVAPVLAAICGCEDKPITITYDRPAEYEIPPTIRRIAIAEFGGATATDKKFGNIAADQLASRLDAYNKKYQRYELVDRKRLKAILDEQDLQLAICDTDSAVQAGKIAKVDAVIYGNVSVSTKDEQASKMSFDFRTRRPKTVYYTKRYCMASVNFTMDDLRTSRTLATVTLTEEYDSDKDAKGAKIGKALGFAGSSLPPAEQILNRLIAECVDQFVRKISPHAVVETVKMERGASKIVQTGNKLARAGHYAEALDCYLRALKTNPGDDGAMFNAGLVYEATGKLDQAEQYYSRAFEIRDKEKYLIARRRVRAETAE